MKKRIALALLTLALLATPVVYVACPQSHAADNSTPWPELYIGEPYDFHFSRETRYALNVGGVVTGYKGNFVSCDTNDDGVGDVFVNMEQVLYYY